MLVWDIVTKTHEVLAHTGFFSPHPASFYNDGEPACPTRSTFP